VKILLCKSHFAGPVSGSDETLVAYATHLHQRGHSLAVVLLYPPARSDQYYARLRGAGVEVITIVSSRRALVAMRGMKTIALYFSGLIPLPVKSRRARRRVWQRISRRITLLYQEHCHRYFEQCSADLIHMMTPDPGAELMIRAGAAAGIPVLYQELGTPHHLPELEAHYERFVKVLPLCAEVAALSPLLARQWREKFISAKTISVLPLLVEDTRSPPTPRPRAADGIRIGFAARLESGKGPMILIEAFALARRELTNASLRMAGSGSQEQAVRARASMLGVGDACEFPGAYTSPEDKSAFMRGLDIFVLPTLAEGTPNSIIEAMAHGLPVIASAVGGIPDLITPETGVLVPPGDAAALADAIMALASNPELRARIGHAARARYEQLFSPQTVLPALMDTYQRIATGNRQSHTTTAPTPGFAHPWLECAQE
jgi:glycosyltransferase involved in cell wall biosynthesis